ncbi:MAG: DUF1289 domain-containing protein [Paracoccus sp. (in: a-proteobacteria)]|nr:DUF1289 domain-containing protein [Paracoccus sp. (in: a-proteobacteria)]
MTEPAPASIVSPCVNICVMHPRAGLCVGCLRSLDEIALWSSLSPEARARVMADLPAREGLIRKRPRLR